VVNSSPHPAAHQPSSAPADAGSGNTAEPSWPLTTWQGWHRFATTEPPAPPQPGEAPRSRDERLAYHSAFVTIRTPAISQLATQVRTLMILGRHQQTTARPSLIVTGPAAAGKTTALLNVGPHNTPGQQARDTPTSPTPSVKGAPISGPPLEATLQPRFSRLSVQHSVRPPQVGEVSGWARPGSTARPTMRRCQRTGRSVPRSLRGPGRGQRPPPGARCR
jgi:hypothetical protein